MGSLGYCLPISPNVSQHYHVKHIKRKQKTNKKQLFCVKRLTGPAGPGVKLLTRLSNY